MTTRSLARPHYYFETSRMALVFIFGKQNTSSQHQTGVGVREALNLLIAKLQHLLLDSEAPTPIREFQSRFKNYFYINFMLKYSTREIDVPHSLLALTNLSTRLDRWRAWMGWHWH